MPDVSYGVSLVVNKGYLNSQIQISNVTADMSIEGMQSLVYTLTTTPTDMSTASLTNVGLAFLRNIATSTVATVQIGVDSAGSFVGFATLRAGEPSLLRLTPGKSYQAIGSSNARLRVDITEG